MIDVYVWLLCLWKALIQRRKVSENKDERGVLDVPTTRVVYVKVTPTIYNWIQPIGLRSKPPRDVDWMDRYLIELQVWTGLVMFLCISIVT